MAFLVILAAAAFSTPAPARPTTPCDEKAEGCLRPGDDEGKDVYHRPGDETQRRHRDVDKDEDDDGGQDSGGW